MRLGPTIACVIAMACALAACGEDSGAAPTPPAAPPTPATLAPSPQAVTAPSGALAVIVSGGDAGQATYSIALVRGDGSTAATVTAQVPQPRRRSDLCTSFLPLVSASATRLYFEDGDTLKSLSASGQVAGIRQLPTPQDVVVVSVSPDDTRLAAALLSVGGDGSGHLDIVAGDLRGGPTTEVLHRDVAASDGLAPDGAQWPAGWHGGNLVLGTGPLHPQGCPASPYAYRVVRPADGSTVATPCSGSDLAVPAMPSPGGVLCNGRNHQPPAIATWDGGTTPLSTDPSCPDTGIVSPDGSRLAGSHGQTQGGACGAADANVWLFTAAGSPQRTAATGNAAGWLDASHVISADPGSGALVILDAASGRVATVSAQGIYAGALPGGL